MTPHNEAKKEEIAKIVIMPGDPKRATMIAEKFLENYKCINEIRGILGYTGFYKGKEVTVMASGMGCPSMGIYSYELYNNYDVDTIIRIGSAGAYTKDLNLYDVVIEDSVYSDSSYARMQNGITDTVLYPSKEVVAKIKEAASKMNIDVKCGKIYCSDVFYSKVVDYKKMYEEKQCLAVEMESFALFHNANHLGKKAACILTISDNLETNEETSPLERQNSFTKMITLALETSLLL